MSDKEEIRRVVFSFYEKATRDVLIGYHFRKIAEKEFPHHPLRPPMEAFAHHLKRIEVFWMVQLLATPMPKSETPFDLISLHKKLFVRPGELNRWLFLFNETLNEDLCGSELKMKWQQKLEHFSSLFRQRLFSLTK